MWLCKLRLDLLPDEHTQPLLSNPLRNGLLLAGIAAAVTAQPLPGIHQPTKTLASARNNLLTAASHLGLISGRFAQSAAAAAAQRDKDEALAPKCLPGASSSSSRVQSTTGSPGFKAGAAGARVLLPGGSSPVRRRARSTGMLAGSFCGSSSSISPTRERSRHSSHHHHRNNNSSSACVSPNRSYSHFSSSSGSRLDSGWGGLMLDTSTSCDCFVSVAAGPGVHSLSDGVSGSDWGGAGRHGGGDDPAPSSLLCAPASDCGCDCWACQVLDGTVLEHAVLQLLELVVAGDNSCMWGLLYALQQAFPVVPSTHSLSSSPQRRVGGGASAAASGKGRQAHSSQAKPPPPQQQQRAVQGEGRQRSSHGDKAKQGTDSSQGTVGCVQGAGGGGCIVVQPLQGASWRRFQLPYTAQELQE